MRRLDLEEFDLRKDHLLRFSSLTEKDIQRIWGNNQIDQIDQIDLSDLQYHLNAPLYQKMIFRYRTCSNQAACLWNAIDQINRRILLNYFELSDINARLPFSIAADVSDEEFNRLSKEYIRDDGNLVEFLAWIANMLGPIDIFQLEGLSNNLMLGERYSISKYYPLWMKNSIEFFFSLPIKKQQILIDRYNHREVDEYNKLVLDDYRKYHNFRDNHNDVEDDDDDVEDDDDDNKDNIDNDDDIDDEDDNI